MTRGFRHDRTRGAWAGSLVAAILRDGRRRRPPQDEDFPRRNLTLHGEGAAKPRVSNHEAEVLMPAAKPNPIALSRKGRGCTESATSSRAEDRLELHRQPVCLRQLLQRHLWT